VVLASFPPFDLAKRLDIRAILFATRLLAPNQIFEADERNRRPAPLDFAPRLPAAIEVGKSPRAREEVDSNLISE